MVTNPEPMIMERCVVPGLKGPGVLDSRWDSEQWKSHTLGVTLIRMESGMKGAVVSGSYD